MKHKILSGGIALVCLSGAMVAAWWAFQQRSSPGPLHSSHAAINELRGNQGCTACHGSGSIVAGSSMAAACNVCHTLIADQITSQVGIHGTLKDFQQRRCEACHREHLGNAASLVSEESFRAAGIADMDYYNHVHVPGYSLSGAHDRLACVKCHTLADSVGVAEGDHRFLGLSQECVTCHEDVHKGELGLKCAECHGQERPFKESPLFKHPDTFPLVDGHAGRKCSECHTTPKVFTGASTVCASCHTDTFEATTKPSHEVTGLGTDCVKCHTTKDWLVPHYEHTDKFLLIGGHEKVACASCHSEGTKQNSVVAFSIDHSCVDCHESPHAPEFVEVATRSRSVGSDACAVCHDRSDKLWSEAMARLTPELHAASGFPLSVPHDKQKCAECHAGLEPGHVRSKDANLWSVRFAGRKAEACEVCHKDPHGGQFAKSASKGACVQCHEATRFFPTMFDADRHAQCEFPLIGNHRGVACALCHKVEGKVRQFVGTTHACADCHKDIHNGTFDGDDLPREVDGKTGCARCHTPLDFNKVAWTAADHKTWTGELLTGKHATAKCDDCHRRDQKPGGKPEPIKAAPKACNACHEDIHWGQFRVGTETDCARCHRSTDDFKTIVFDHDKDSRFKLDKDHRNLECVACHKPVEFGGRSVVRYKPLGTVCADCHDSRPQRNLPEGRSP